MLSCHGLAVVTNWSQKMLIVRKNQLFDQEWQVCRYVKGEFAGVVYGMGRNVGTWESAAKSKRTAQRWAKQCRRDDLKSTYRVETAN